MHCFSVTDNLINRGNSLPPLHRDSRPSHCNRAGCRTHAKGLPRVTNTVSLTLPQSSARNLRCWKVPRTSRWHCQRGQVNFWKCYTCCAAAMRCLSLFSHYFQNYSLLTIVINTSIQGRRYSVIQLSIPTFIKHFKRTSLGEVKHKDWDSTHTFFEGKVCWVLQFQTAPAQEFLFALVTGDLGLRPSSNTMHKNQHSK